MGVFFTSPHRKSTAVQYSGDQHEYHWMIGTLGHNPTAAGVSARGSCSVNKIKKHPLASLNCLSEEWSVDTTGLRCRGAIIATGISGNIIKTHPHNVLLPDHAAADKAHGLKICSQASIAVKLTSI